MKVKYLWREIRLLKLTVNADQEFLIFRKSRVFDISFLFLTNLLVLLV